MKRLILFLLFCCAAYAQIPAFPFVVQQFDPTGNCTVQAQQIVVNSTTNTIWTCNAVTGFWISGTSHTCYIIIGADNGPSLTTADIAPQGRQCFIPKNATLVEIDVASDTGEPAVVVARNHGGTLTSLSASIAPAVSGGVSCVNVFVPEKCIDGSTPLGTLTTTSLSAGDWIETYTSSSASTAHRISISVTYNY
jgi:hypothetical protein